MKYFIFILLAVGLFVLNGILGKLMFNYNEKLFKYDTFHFQGYGTDKSFSGNFILKTFFPSVYISICAWIFQTIGAEALVREIWFVVLGYWLLRIIFLLVVLNRANITNYIYEGLSLVLSVGTAFLVYKVFILYCIDNGIAIFLSRDELRSGIEFALFAYVIAIAWRILVAKGCLSKNRIYNRRLVTQAIKKRFEKLFNRYSDKVEVALEERLTNEEFDQYHDELVRTFFAIMIIEDLNRPYIIRKLEYCLHLTVFRKRAMSTGIMQIKSQEPVDDKRSIELAIEIFIQELKDFIEEKTGKIKIPLSLLERIAQRYNHSFDYEKEVSYIADEIGEFIVYG